MSFVSFQAYYVTANTAPIYSAQDGLWSDPATWVGGVVPATKNRPVIITHVVQMDVSFSGSIDCSNGSLVRDMSLPPTLAQIGNEMDARLMPAMAYLNSLQVAMGNVPDATASAVQDSLEGDLIKIDELHKLQGLSAGNPMTVTPTSRTVAAISLTLTGDGVTTTTVSRD